MQLSFAQPLARICLLLSLVGFAGVLSSLVQPNELASRVVAAEGDAAGNAAAIERVGEDIRYLTSAELEGRGPGTAGIDKAADYL